MISLNFQPEIEAQLAAEAEARGLALDDYVKLIIAARPVDSQPDRPLDEARLSRDPRQGFREIAEGTTVSARQASAQLREEYNIRG